jgi:hypothetical protein
MAIRNQFEYNNNGIVQDNTNLGTSALKRSNVIMSYPLSRDESYLGRIRFVVKEAKPINPVLGANRLFDTINLDNLYGQTGATKKAKSDDDGYTAYEPRPADKEKQEQRVAKNAEKDQLVKSSISGLTGIKYQTAKNTPIIDLYMPAGNIVMNEGVQYENVNLDPMGAATSAALASGDSIMSAFGKGLAEGLQSIFNMRDNSTEQLARLATARLMDKIPGGVGRAGQLAVQATTNPNTRAMFRNVNIREFNFTFKFIATSASEARIVEEIIRHFRTEMYPEAINPAGVPIGFEFPNAFDISFKYKGQNAKIPKIETSYLRNIQTSYNPTSATFHADGQPNEIDLTLNFVEVRTLNKQDIQGEFG